MPPCRKPPGEPLLSRSSTSALVQELQKREAVDSMVIAPHEDAPIVVNGPAIILIVRD